MTDLEGVQVATSSHRRGLQATLRLFRKDKALLHDSSYWKAIELSGAEESVLAFFSQITVSSIILPGNCSYSYIEFH